MFIHRELGLSSRNNNLNVLGVSVNTEDLSDCFVNSGDVIVSLNTKDVTIVVTN